MSRKTRKSRRACDRHEAKTQRGMGQIAQDHCAKREEYKLDWFNPTEAQKEIIRSMIENECTFVQGGSGVGKSTTAISQALIELKRGYYRKLVFIKTPSECGSDQIGYLSGDANEKLSAHFEAMRSIFHTFMSKAKLEMEEKTGKIEFTIPNFVAGKTFYDSIVIIDESQMLNTDTLKMLLERLDDSSKVVVLGDKGQRYSAKKREDGFSYFIDRITEDDADGRYSVEELMGYVELTSNDNMRGKLSRRIGELFEEEDS